MLEFTKNVKAITGKEIENNAFAIYLDDFLMDYTLLNCCLNLFYQRSV